MNAKETILYSDLDGTLFDSRNRISPENLAAIEAYIDAGGRFAIATGRAPQNALGFLTGLCQNAPAIVMNGAGAYDFRQGRYLFCAHMDRQSLDPLLETLLADIPELELQVYTEEEILYCLPEERCQPTLLRLHRPCRFVDFRDTLGQPLVKCLLYAAPEYDAALGQALTAAAPGRFALAPALIRVAGETLHFYEIMPLGVSKAQAWRSCGRPGAGRAHGLRRGGQLERPGAAPRRRRGGDPCQRGGGGESAQPLHHGVQRGTRDRQAAGGDFAGGVRKRRCRKGIPDALSIPRKRFAFFP